MGGPTQRSVFAGAGFQAVVDATYDEIRSLYLADDTPWIIGYSGGKDSSATLQLTWIALEGLPPEKRKKPVYVVSTDTLVENPVVASWVTLSLQRMREAAKAKGLPVEPNRLTPRVEDSFWVNLIGKGYPAPRHKFRWCTERLKIKPSNAFIMSVVKRSGEAILLLGARKQESQARAKVLSKNEKFRVRDRLSPNSTLPGCLVYTPVEDWSNDDVWTYLTSVENPWGHDNKDLLGMYAGASPDGECPLVVDSSTPSCGDSRFGCWVCTLVEKDKSMSAMIQNDHEKRWMKPMLDLRNALDFRTSPDGKDHHLRDYRLELITMAELHEIRRIWVSDKHELEDRLPVIYKEETGEEFPGASMDDSLGLRPEDFQSIKDLCGADRTRYELIRDLIGATNNVRHSARRTGLQDEFDDILKRHLFSSRAEARDFHLKLGITGNRVDEDGGEYNTQQPIA